MFKPRKKSIYFILAIILAFGFPLLSHAAPGDTTRVSFSSWETNAGSDSPAVSANGRYIAFQSDATNLVNGDTNGTSDIFHYDTQTGVTTRVSVATDGTQGNDVSDRPSISADGRYVAFDSEATNLVSGDIFGHKDVFVHDTQIGTTTCVSVKTDGTLGNYDSYRPSISSDGRYVAFASLALNLESGDTNGSMDIFLHDTQTGITTRISEATDGTLGDHASGNPSISNDGRFVAFYSYASNLVIGDTNLDKDAFVHDTQTGTTTRVSVATDGTEGNDASDNPDISGDGRYVAFNSKATNLVSGDTNNSKDVFVKDTQTGTTTRVSLATDGTQGNGDSYEPAITSDGRYVVFHSGATNLVIGDTNGWADIFAHDTQTSTTTRVSVGTSGTQGNNSSFYPAISGDGRFVIFESWVSNFVDGDTNRVPDIFMHDTLTDTTTRVSVVSAEANDDSTHSNMSFYGRYVVFHSMASNLVSGDTNGQGDIFWHDTQTKETIRVSVATDGSENVGSSYYHSAISADGLYVAFASSGNNLVSGDTNGSADAFIHNTQTGTTTRISVANGAGGTEGNQDSYSPSISATGRYIAFGSSATNLVGSDTNGAYDVFVRDGHFGIRPRTYRVSVASDGTEGNNHSGSPSISGEGRHVAFISSSTNLVSGDTNGESDIFVHDNQTDTTTRVSVASDGTQGNGSSYDPKISADGRYVAFYSNASNLVTGDYNGVSDIFVHDTLAGTTTRVSVSTAGTEGNNSSQRPSISNDGRYIVFRSASSNLVSGDTNGEEDIFVHDIQTGTTVRVSLATGGSQGNNDSDFPAISGDGIYVAFDSSASNLVSGDTNGDYDIFLNEINISPIENDNVGFWNPNKSKWYLKDENSGGDADNVFKFGPVGVGWTPITGDWDDDGVDTIGYWNPVKSKWYLKNDNSGGEADLVFYFGPVGVGWTPIIGDWDGNGSDTIGYWNPNKSKWYLKNDNSGGDADVVFVYGPVGVGWEPIVGDWDGDGDDTIGFYNPNKSKWYLKNDNSSGNTDVTFYFGPVGVGWEPIVGDWDGDGDDTIGFYNPNKSKWYLKNSNSGGDADEVFVFGPVGVGWEVLTGNWQ